jgi:hypothetical protein
MTTQLVYGVRETQKKWTDSGADFAMTLANLAFGSGRVGPQWDRGAGALPWYHDVLVCIQWAATAVVGDAAEIYLFESDGTYQVGTVGTVDAALTTEKRRNPMFIGSVICDTTSGATNVVKVFHQVPIVQRYVSPGIWNASATKNFQNTSAVSALIIIPTPDQIQGAV